MFQVQFECERSSSSMIGFSRLRQSTDTPPNFNVYNNVAYVTRPADIDTIRAETQHCKYLPAIVHNRAMIVSVE